MLICHDCRVSYTPESGVTAARLVFDAQWHETYVAPYCPTCAAALDDACIQIVSGQVGIA